MVGWGRVYEIVGFRQLWLVKPALTFGIYKDMPLDSLNNEQATFNTTHEHEIFGDRDLPSWLTQQQIFNLVRSYYYSILIWSFQLIP